MRSKLARLKDHTLSHHRKIAENRQLRAGHDPMLLDDADGGSGGGEEPSSTSKQMASAQRRAQREQRRLDKENNQAALNAKTGVAPSPMKRPPASVVETGTTTVPPTPPALRASATAQRPPSRTAPLSSNKAPSSSNAASREPTPPRDAHIPPVCRPRTVVATTAAPAQAASPNTEVFQGMNTSLTNLALTQAQITSVPTAFSAAAAVAQPRRGAKQQLLFPSAATPTALRAPSATAMIASVSIEAAPTSSLTAQSIGNGGDACKIGDSGDGSDCDDTERVGFFSKVFGTKTTKAKHVSKTSKAARTAKAAKTKAAKVRAKKTKKSAKKAKKLEKTLKKRAKKDAKREERAKKKTLRKRAKRTSKSNGEGGGSGVSADGDVDGGGHEHMRRAKKTAKRGSMKAFIPVSLNCFRIAI